MKEKIVSIGKTICTIIVALAIIQTSVPTYADVGSFEDYDSGSDWGSDSGSSWDWGSSSSSDWGSSYDSSYSGVDSDFLLSPSIIYLFFSNPGLFAVIVIVAIIVGVVHKKNNNNRRVNDDITRLRYHTAINNEAKNEIKYDDYGVLLRIRNTDPNFSKIEFESFAKEVFIKLQNAWTERDWEKIRPFETPELFQQHKAQLDGYIKNNQINVMDRISVNDMNLVSFSIEGNKDILVVDLKTRMADYIIDATTKEVIKGDKTKEYYHTYTLTFTRTNGKVTEANNTNELKTTNCPNCGAPTTITSSGRCEYCNSVITTEDHGWALAGLKRRN